MTSIGKLMANNKKMAKTASRTRMALYLIAIAIFAGLAAYAVGPRPVVDTTIAFDESALPDDLDTYVAASEARFDDLRPGNERQIVWAYPVSRARTPIAIVYIHGFSASPGPPQGTRPQRRCHAGRYGSWMGQ